MSRSIGKQSRKSVESVHEEEKEGYGGKDLHGYTLYVLSGGRISSCFHIMARHRRLEGLCADSKCFNNMLNRCGYLHSVVWWCNG